LLRAGRRVAYVTLDLSNEVTGANTLYLLERNGRMRRLRLPTSDGGFVAAAERTGAIWTTGYRRGQLYLVRLAVR
jgi:hypothetical protein